MKLTKEFADAMNRLTPEEVAESMEKLPADALEWAVKFEALSHPNVKPKDAPPQV